MFIKKDVYAFVISSFIARTARSRFSQKGYDFDGSLSFIECTDFPMVTGKEPSNDSIHIIVKPCSAILRSAREGFKYQISAGTYVQLH